MKRKDRKAKWNHVVRNILLYVCGFAWMLSARSASADVLDTDGIFYSRTPGSLWMEVAVIIIVGLMVIFAIAAICFMHYQKKKEEEARMQREEAEREEQ